MKVIGIGRLVVFNRRYPQVRSALNAWLKVAKQSKWKNLIELRQRYPSADGGVQDIYTVFNIAGNNYRLITIVDYGIQTIAIVKIFTHADYDKWCK